MQLFGFSFFIIKNISCSYELKLLFISFDRMVTKNQILNTIICQPKVFVVVSIWKKKMPGCSLLFSKWKDRKNFGWHLVLSIWFLVTVDPMKRTLLLFLGFLWEFSKQIYPKWNSNIWKSLQSKTYNFSTEFDSLQIKNNFIWITKSSA
jgi:hypothetical protein